MLKKIAQEINAENARKKQEEKLEEERRQKEIEKLNSGYKVIEQIKQLVSELVSKDPEFREFLKKNVVPGLGHHREGFRYGKPQEDKAFGTGGTCRKMIPTQTPEVRLEICLDRSEETREVHFLQVRILFKKKDGEIIFSKKEIEVVEGYFNKILNFQEYFGRTTKEIVESLSQLTTREGFYRSLLLSSGDYLKMASS